jgi:hypothetical protein
LIQKNHRGKVRSGPVGTVDRESCEMALIRATECKKKPSAATARLSAHWP